MVDVVAIIGGANSMQHRQQTPLIGLLFSPNLFSHRASYLLLIIHLSAAATATVRAAPKADAVVVAV